MIPVLGEVHCCQWRHFLSEIITNYKNYFCEYQDPFTSNKWCFVPDQTKPIQICNDHDDVCKCIIMIIHQLFVDHKQHPYYVCTTCDNSFKGTGAHEA